MLAGCKPWERWPCHHGHDGETHGHDERGEHGHHPHRRGQPADRPDPRRPEGRDLLPEIEPIVIYLQENHSYDSYFGMVPKGDGYRVRRGVSQNWVSTHRQINGGQMDCTEENPSDIQLGEAFSSSVINAVMGSPAWPKTGLLFMYDEHDHTSVLRLIETKFNLGALTRRDANADNLPEIPPPPTSATVGVAAASSRASSTADFELTDSQHERLALLAHAR